MFRTILIALFSVLAASHAHAGAVTEQVTAAVVESANGQQRPVVLFDLDDTLFDSRSRKAIIFKEYAATLLREGRDLEVARTLLELPLSAYHYDVGDTLLKAGITSQELHQEIEAFWKERFFTNAYVELDTPLAGAASYVSELERQGARIVYLTGRDTVRMRAGTLSALAKAGFPQGTLLTKPRISMDDTEFKQEAFESIQIMGTVVALFENEPRNLNAMMDFFPNATGVFVDTLHSKLPDVPSPNALVIQDYL